MKKKTQRLIARIIVLILVALMVIGAVSPYILGASKLKTYTNKKLHMKVQMPSSGINHQEKIGSNGREFSIDSHLSVRIIYGDIYEEVLELEGTDSSSLPRKDIYIESKYTTKTWNNQTYVTKYFKEIIDSAKTDYTYKVDKTTLSGIPAWRCKYTGKTVTSSGYYYLTVNSAGLHILQIDSYLSSISNYKNTAKRIKDSYEITDKFIPGKDEKNDDKKTETKPAETKPKKTETKPKEEKKTNTVGIILMVAGIVAVAAAVIAGIIWYVMKNDLIAKNREKRIRNRKVKVTKKK